MYETTDFASTALPARLKCLLTPKIIIFKFSTCVCVAIPLSQFSRRTYYLQQITVVTAADRLIS